jgi:hypothetical protein
MILLEIDLPSLTARRTLSAQYKPLSNNSRALVGIS